MPFHQPDAIKYYTFDIFKDAPLTHAVFTRQGGVSRDDFSSLNMGMTVGDNREHVQQNKRLAFQEMGRDMHGFGDSWLVHGVDVLIYDEPDPPDFDNQTKADIVLTDNPAVTLFMRYADCTPLLFYDPAHRAIALAHAGWRGTVQRVGQAAVQAMQQRYGSDPAGLRVGIGPAISAARYEIGAEVIDATQAAFGAQAAALLPEYNGATHFDQWAANQLVLEEAGVQHIEQSKLCTATDLQDWFSHRAEQGKTGRFGVLMGLTE